jgi:uncharacterized protein (DUF433 family)
MPIELSPQEREILEQHANRKIKPSKRQKAKALLSLAEGMTLERIAEHTGITKDELLGLFNLFTKNGLAGLDLAPQTSIAKEKRRLARYPTIKKTPGVCGGAARIDGTRIPIWQLVEERNLGASESQLLNDYRSLKARDLAVAWDYADEHREEIDSEIRRNMMV